jgi:hypothetical protein
LVWRREKEKGGEILDWYGGGKGRREEKRRECTWELLFPLPP